MALGSSTAQNVRTLPSKHRPVHGPGFFPGTGNTRFEQCQAGGAPQMGGGGRPAMPPFGRAAAGEPEKVDTGQALGQLLSITLFCGLLGDSDVGLASSAQCFAHSD